MDTRPLELDRTDAWAIHDCLQAQLQGFAGRHETAEPWHATSLMSKLRPALLFFETATPDARYPVDITKGELECIDYNVPRTSYKGAGTLLLRVYHVLEEMSFNFPLLGEEPEQGPSKLRLTSWRNQRGLEPYP